MPKQDLSLKEFVEVVQALAMEMNVSVPEKLEQEIRFRERDYSGGVNLIMDEDTEEPA